MNNPFLSNGFVMPTASLNTVKIMGLGDLIINNPSILNKTAKELLCGETVSLLMNQFFSKYGLDSQNRFKILENLSENISGEMQENACAVLRELGYNLGYLLLVLKRGDLENRAARDNWSNEHWEYWKSLSKIELAGGLVRGRFGKKMLSYTYELFNLLDITPYEISISCDGDILPLIGAARLTSQFCDSVAFDFGHSYVKSCVVKKGTLNTLFVQNKIEAKHVIGDNDNEKYELSDALLLDEFITGVIISTLNNSVKHIDTSKTSYIAISIANYVSDGKIAQRGSYRKLSLVAENYGLYLSNKLSALTHRPFKVMLVHDSTSAAIAAKQSDKDIAVITLGTSLGVGFTDCISNLPAFNYILG